MMISDLIRIGGDKWVYPLAVIVAVAWLLRGLASLHRSKSSSRQEFLDLWSRRTGQDDVWLEVAVRHLFGTYLPAAIIRQLMASPQAARALLEVSEFWELLEMDDETHELCWKAARYQSPARRILWFRFFDVAYFVAMSAALFFIYRAVAMPMSPLLVLSFWIYGLFLGGLGFRMLHLSDSLKTAHRAAPRWLGLA